jgi:hypothetical protein
VVGGDARNRQEIRAGTGQGFGTGYQGGQRVGPLASDRGGSIDLGIAKITTLR